MLTRLAGVAAALLVLGGAALWLMGGGGDRRLAADSQTLAVGARVYEAACAACHGKNLEGQPNWQRPLPDGGLPAPPHDESGHTWHHPDAILFRITKFGGAAEAPPGFKSNMPAFADSLSDDEIRAVLAYIRRSWPAAIQARQAEIDRRFREAR